MKALIFGQRTFRYFKLNGREDEESYSEHSAPINTKSSGLRTENSKSPLWRKNLRSVCWIWLNLVLFGLSVTAFLLSLQNNYPVYASNTDKSRNHLLKQFSMPSPLLDEIDVEVAPKRMDATLLLAEPLSIFRQEPSVEVDIAWKKLWDSRPVPISKEQVLAMGKDPAQAVQIPKDWGYGDETYFGRVDVFHQIHCLDALRRETYFEHYYSKKYPNGFNDTTEFHRVHLSHCIYLLLQNIMCSASTDVYSHIWTDTLDHPFPDFCIDHKCKDFGSILEWQSKNAIDERKFVELKRPDGYPYHIMSHKFKELHGWFSNHEDDRDLTGGEIA